jgi:hypothetical protein
MPGITIRLSEARNLILQAQLLNKPQLACAEPESCLDLLQQLGYVQIDTLAVVQRSHNLIFWSRCTDYDESVIHRMQGIDRSVFEYWGHAMAYLPVSDYRYYLPKMENFKNPVSPWSRYQFEKSKGLLKPVLERIREEGPLGAKDFKHEKKKGGSWWDWKPAKVALELLFWQGELMLTARRNFQKIYDLRERVLPEDTDTRMPETDELARFIVLRGLKALGIAGRSEIYYFLQPGTSRDSDMQLVARQDIDNALEPELENGTVQELNIKENEKNNFYALKEDFQSRLEAKFPADILHILSPFDNLIIQRYRLKWFFGFDYALECYLPAAKRKYGYFVMPILWNGRFIGRMDPKADRKNKILQIVSLHFEPGFEADDHFLHILAGKLQDFARFNDCEKIRLERVQPAKYKQALSYKLSV